MDELIRKCIRAGQSVIRYILNRVDEVGDCGSGLMDVLQESGDMVC